MTCPICNGVGSIAGYQPQTMSHYSNRCDRCLGTGTAMIGYSYGGIGSRDTPIGVAREMELIASLLASRGFVLRSGRGKRRTPPTPDTDSADLAFERGCDLVNGRKVIRPYGGSDAAMAHASMFHPNWAACDDHARGLHARNSLIMLSDWLDDPVRFVVCWTKDGKIAGGTGQALRIATSMAIPVFNLAVTPASSLWSWLDGRQ